MSIGFQHVLQRFFLELLVLLPAWYVALRIRHVNPTGARRKKALVWLLAFAPLAVLPRLAFLVAESGIGGDALAGVLSADALLTLGESLLMHALLLAMIGLWMGLWTDAPQ